MCICVISNLVHKCVYISLTFNVLMLQCMTSYYKVELTVMVDIPAELRVSAVYIGMCMLGAENAGFILKQRLLL